ncbi:MAG: hypothetical protein SGJ18_04665 [Pseudomonadota bacterium]|nr:hypothetical protein [Pseudomonadota bacterium]
MPQFLLFILLFFSQTLFAEIKIPVNLSQLDRLETLRILGMGTSSKILSEPYPLGGYSGLELGVSIEFLDLTDLSSLGATIPDKQENTTYPKLSLGKGLYNNIDMFFNFTPYSKNSGLSQYGGMIRWGFYQSPYVPTCLSLLVHGNATNVSQNIFSQSFGVDLVAGFTLNYVSVYFGGGQIESRGQFVGINSSNNIETEHTSSVHTLMGTILTLDKVFVAIELDRYSDAMISAKIGIRN